MSRYANHDAAGWIESHNAATNRYQHSRKRRKPLPDLPEKLTPFQTRVANILGIVGGGIYNAPISFNRIDWVYGFEGVSLTWRGCLCTFDRHDLTNLVFLCHEARIRCELNPAGPHMLRLSFFPRKAEGDISQRHPDLDEAVAEFWKWYKPEGSKP
jgi:hypothetical protein